MNYASHKDEDFLRNEIEKLKKTNKRLKIENKKLIQEHFDDIIDLKKVNNEIQKLNNMIVIEEEKFLNISEKNESLKESIKKVKVEFELLEKEYNKNELSIRKLFKNYNFQQNVYKDVTERNIDELLCFVNIQKERCKKRDYADKNECIINFEEDF